MALTEEEKKLVAPFMTNVDKPVFVLTNLPEVVKGALFSRYSRTPKSLREVLLREFMQSEELNLREMLASVPKAGPEGIKTGKAEKFYERVLVGYGDDSVAELAGAHIALEGISILATKAIEDARIGLSPLEKSTRYVYFDQKREDGIWPYHRDEMLMNSDFADLYVETCDMCFDKYSELVPAVSAFVKEKEPQGEDVSERAYESTVRAKTCDILRGMLPASTLTNMGLFGNGRAFEYLLTRMYADDLLEMNTLARSMQEELSKVIPSFVKRADNKYGLSMQAYFKRVRAAMDSLVEEYRKPGGKEEVKLVKYDAAAETKIITAALYPYLSKPMGEIARIVEEMTDEEKQAVIAAYTNKRENRRHKPGRAFEHAYYTFDICANFGAYRDMHRHRMLTQQRQLLSTHHGYMLPGEIVEAGLEDAFSDAMEQARNAYGQISKKYETHAQYVVPLAFNIRWYMSFNLREAYHMLELRTSMQGHPDYRRIAQEMFKQIKEVHPKLAEGMEFVDLEEYRLSRLEAEKKIDNKMKEIAKKYEL
ncbi:thymidylate synthase [Candidatus Micrarchaeota archaeon]|nr:thymidylate synthase [Candidatus Micrarchaeota archaeon]